MSFLALEATDRLKVMVKDRGRGFDIQSFDPDRPPDPLLDHGRGLFLMARLCDEFKLRRDGGLEVELIKRARLRRDPHTDFERGIGPGGRGQYGRRRRAMLDEIGEGFDAFDREYRYVHVNRVALRRLGKGLDELLGRRPWEVFPALDGSALLEAYREAMELGRPAVLEHRSVVDGQWLEVRIYPTSTGISCYYRGIDERKAPEQALERSRRRTGLLEWVAGSLLASDDPQSLVEELCRRVMAELDCQVFFNFLIDERTDRLHLNAWAGISKEEARRIEWLDSGEAVCGRAAQKAERVVAEEIASTPDPRTELVASYRITACAAHPLMVDGRLLGTLTFGSRTRTRFSDDDLALMKAVADHVAMAVHHRAAEQTLARYRLLAANSRDIILFMDRGGRIIEANEAAERAYGYTRAELLELTIADLRADQTKTEMAAQMAEADERGTLFESIHRRKDGSVFPVEVSSRGANVGGRRTLVSVVRDITERTCAEEALRESERRERFALKHAPAAIYEIDFRPPGGRFVSVNDYMCTYSGYSREELLAMDPFAFLDEKGQATFRKRIEATLAGEPMPPEVEYRFRTKGGEERIAALQVTPICEDGKPVRGFVVGHDVTEHKRLEGKLAAAEEQSRHLVRYAAAAIYEADLRTRRFTSVNDRMCALTGYSREELLAMDPLELLDAEGRERILDRATMVLNGEQDEVAPEYRLATKSGEERWAALNVSVVWEAGQPARAFVVAHDITQRRQAEANQALLTEVLQVLDRPGDLRSLVGDALRAILGATGFDAVGVRLRQGDDYPYFEHNGFTDEFLEEENFLCVLDAAGDIVTDAVGRALLECTCGLVASGRTDQSMSCFTPGGSFWTNRSTDLLALPPAEEPRTNPRNRCIHTGFQSVGLFPVRAGEEIVGLLQLNDRREGRFTPELVLFYESLAKNIGLALQRVSAEDALRKSEERYRTIVETTAEGLLIGAPDGAILYANPQMARMLGYTVDELQGMCGLDLVFPDFESRVTVNRAALAAGEMIRGEMRLKGKDGESRWTSFSSTPMFDGSGTYVGNLTMHSDITGRRRREQEREELLGALGESEVRYRSMADGMPFPVWVTDAGGAVEFVNRAYLEYFGREQEDPGADWSPIHPDDQEWYSAELQAACRERRDLHAEVRVQAADGSWHWVESFASPRYSSGGEFLGMVGCSPDITERRRAEKALHESEVRLRFHLENTPLAVVEWDQDFVVTRWAGEAEAMFGWSTEETVGRPIMDLHMIYLDDVPIVERTMEKLTDGAHSRVVSSNRNSTKDGRVIECTWYNSVLLDAKGHMSSVMSVVEDITDRRRAEAQLREQARLSEALTAIDALVHSSLDTTKAVNAALSEGAVALGASIAVVMTHRGGGFRIDYLFGVPTTEIGRAIPEEHDPAGLAALETREPVVIEDAQSNPLMSSFIAGRYDVRSLLVVPFASERDALGCLYFVFQERPHVFTQAELDFGRKLGATLSLAIENARLYGEQQRIAVTLQEHLVHKLPSVPGLEIGTIAQSAYAPALVGGDFSDVFVLDDGQVAILIGDVAGKGVEAAGLTETVRSTVRALAIVDASPAFVLGKTNELLLRHDGDGPHATAFYCLLEPRTGHLAYASAGHPAPIHLRPHLCGPLAVRFGLPLGSFAGSYGVAHTVLTLDDYLVLCTDGITEARRAGEMYGERRLVVAVAQLRGRSAQEMAEGLVGDVGSYADKLADDIEVVALRLA